MCCAVQQRRTLFSPLEILPLTRPSPFVVLSSSASELRLPTDVQSIWFGVNKTSLNFVFVLLPSQAQFHKKPRATLLYTANQHNQGPACFQGEGGMVEVESELQQAIGVLSILAVLECHRILLHAHAPEVTEIPEYRRTDLCRWQKCSFRAPILCGCQTHPRRSTCDSQSVTNRPPNKSLPALLFLCSRNPAKSICRTPLFRSLFNVDEERPIYCLYQDYFFLAGASLNEGPPSCPYGDERTEGTRRIKSTTALANKTDHASWRVDPAEKKIVPAALALVRTIKRSNKNRN